MFVTIFERPVGVTMKLAGWDTTNPNKRAANALGTIVSPRHASLGGEFGDVFVIFKISPKFGLGTGLNL